MRWLPLIGWAGLNPVIIANRDIQLFLQIPVKISKK